MIYLAGICVLLTLGASLFFWIRRVDRREAERSRKGLKRLGNEARDG